MPSPPQRCQASHQARQAEAAEVRFCSTMPLPCHFMYTWKGSGIPAWHRPRLFCTLRRVSRQVNLPMELSSIVAIIKGGVTALNLAFSGFQASGFLDFWVSRPWALPLACRLHGGAPRPSACSHGRQTRTLKTQRPGNPDIWISGKSTCKDHGTLPCKVILLGAKADN